MTRLKQPDTLFPVPATTLPPSHGRYSAATAIGTVPRSALDDRLSKVSDVRTPKVGGSVPARLLCGSDLLAAPRQRTGRASGRSGGRSRAAPAGTHSPTTALPMHVTPVKLQ